MAIEIEERLSRTEPSMRTKWCIYRVPDDIRELNKDAYTPKVVSIGPFHYGNERLQNVETHKWEYLKKFVERTGCNVDDLVSFIGELEPSVRHCYADNIAFEKRLFVKIILLDSCFIIELFWRFHRGDWHKDDAITPRTRLFNVIMMDLLLLENQIPFFVLEKLFNRAFPSSVSNGLPSFLELTFNCFNFFNIQGLTPDGVDVCHFMDLLRYFHLQQPSSLQPERTEKHEILNFSAIKLHEAGLRFEVNDKSKCLLGLQLSGRNLKIPKIIVDERTEVLFRNMVAFEQCHCMHECYVTDYVFIFDFLIDTAEDVDVLIQNGIMAHNLDDSNAVAKLFNGLGKGVIWGNCNSDYVQLSKKLNKFYTNPCQKLKATLRRDYCKTPWQIAASIAGILLLFLTLIQTIFSGIQFETTLS